MRRENLRKTVKGFHVEMVYADSGMDHHTEYNEYGDAIVHAPPSGEPSAVPRSISQNHFLLNTSNVIVMLCCGLSVDNTNAGADVMIDAEARLTPLQRRRMKQGLPFTSRKLNDVTMQRSIS